MTDDPKGTPIVPRGTIVALSRSAMERVRANKVGVIGPTKKQLEKLAEHKGKNRRVTL